MNPRRRCEGSHEVCVSIGEGVDVGNREVFGGGRGRGLGAF